MRGILPENDGLLEVSSIESTPARNELLRYLRLGQSVRSRNGANRVRNFILATQADPAIHKLCLSHQIQTADLCLACTEILDAAPVSAGSQEERGLSLVHIFSDLQRLEELLKKLHAASEGQAALHRRAAIIACAQNYAAQIPPPRIAPRRPPTHSTLLKKSLFNHILIILLLVGIIAAVIFAAFLWR